MGGGGEIGGKVRFDASAGDAGAGSSDLQPLTKMRSHSMDKFVDKVRSDPESVFDRIDKDSDGFISPAEVMFFLRNISSKWKAKGNLHLELEFFADLDEEGHGRVSREVFCRRVQHLNPTTLHNIGKYLVEEEEEKSKQAKKEEVRNSVASLGPPVEEEDGEEAAAELDASEPEEEDDNATDEGVGSGPGHLVAPVAASLASSVDEVMDAMGCGEDSRVEEAMLTIGAEPELLQQLEALMAPKLRNVLEQGVTLFPELEALGDAWQKPDLCKAVDSFVGRIGFPELHVTKAQHRRLEHILEENGEEVRAVPVENKSRLAHLAEVVIASNWVLHRAGNDAEDEDGIEEDRVNIQLESAIAVEQDDEDEPEPEALVDDGAMAEQTEADEFEEMLDNLKKCETRRRRVGGGFKTEILDPETGKWTTSDAYFRRKRIVKQLQKRMKKTMSREFDSASPSSSRYRGNTL